MSEKTPNEEDAKPSPERADNSTHEKRGAEHAEQFTEEWFAGIGAGIKGVSRKLLDHVPPDLREKVVDQARSHGPGAAATAVNAAALKTRSLKAKLALKTLAKLLRLLDSKDSGKKE